MTIADRVAALDWPALTARLEEHGFAQTTAILDPAACAQLAAGFDDERRFRSTIDMRRYRFGEGSYRYFAHPLPDPIEQARRAFYAPLAAVANAWAAALGQPADFPDGLDAFLDRCHAAGQRRPTPLLLRYVEGGFNTLHQDVYGEVAFPFQVVTVLNRPGADFGGGQFVLLEQRPRAQSRAHVIDLEQGGFLIFPTRHRPVRGTRGFYRATMRHGVATVTAGERVTLGVIFHDAT